jgi:hypothetical protein
MKLTNIFLCAGFILGVATPLQCASLLDEKQILHSASDLKGQTEVEEDDVEIDDSDVFAVPSNHSEFEEEEEINRIEERELFKIPQNPQ